MLPYDRPRRITRQIEKAEARVDEILRNLHNSDLSPEAVELAECELEFVDRDLAMLYNF